MESFEKAKVFYAVIPLDIRNLYTLGCLRESNRINDLLDGEKKNYTVLARVIYSLWKIVLFDSKAWCFGYMRQIMATSIVLYGKRV